MPVNNSDIFKCDLHDFSTSDIEKWDEHCAAESHPYDLHDKCAGKCGEDIHIIVDTKLGKEAKRIPRGYMCDACKNKVKNAPKAQEPGEKARKEKK